VRARVPDILATKVVVQPALGELKTIQEDLTDLGKRGD